MLIFDGFPDKQHADNFAIAVRDTFWRGTRVCDSQEESNKYDVFPFALDPPIVLVIRDEPDGPKLETSIINLVGEFNGHFAGT